MVMNCESFGENGEKRCELPGMDYSNVILLVSSLSSSLSSGRSNSILSLAASVTFDICIQIKLSSITTLFKPFGPHRTIHSILSVSHGIEKVAITRQSRLGKWWMAFSPN